MKTRLIGVGLLGLLAALSAPADDRADREKLFGAWQLQDPAQQGPATSWTFMPNGAELQVTQTDAEKMVSKFHCKTEGSPCEIKTSGKKATLSMWYNGNKLVQMETRGSDVVKRRFGVLAKDVMELEVIPIAPSGKTETYRYQRAQASPAK